MYMCTLSGTPEFELGPSVRSLTPYTQIILLVRDCATLSNVQVDSERLSRAIGLTMLHSLQLGILIMRYSLDTLAKHLVPTREAWQPVYVMTPQESVQPNLRFHDGGSVCQSARDST